MANTDEPCFDCVDTGEGPAVLFLPGSYSTAAAWRPIQKLLGAGWRTVTTSLCGYGGTPDTRTPQDTDMQHEVRIVEALARRIGQPVHLVGHSFGGTVALAAALGGRVDVASLALFEANPLDVIRHGDAAGLYADTLAMSRAFEAAVQEGEADAPARIIDFWGGAGAFAAMPEAVKDYCRRTASANVLDWHTDFGFQVTAGSLAALDVPVLLVRGERANAAMVAITDVLGQHLPNVRPAVVDGAGHFLVSTHAAQCAALLASWLNANGPSRNQTFRT